MKKILILLSFCSIIFAGPDTFKWAIEFVLKREGGYCHDRGSESNFGLSSKWYPKENMKTMTIEHAKELYKCDYWDAIGAEMIGDSCLALVYLDCAVLFGQPAAKKMLKKSFNGFTYDKSVLRGFYIDRIVAQIKTCPDDSKYLKSWMTRIADLSAVANIQ